MLNRLFSETNLLVKNISFQPGINIIYGKYSGEKEATGINGIGKSSIVRLINYMLLSDSAEKEFNKEKYSFLKEDGHSLTLEFQIKNKKQFIHRVFSNPDRILFGPTPKKLDEYTKAEMLEVLSGLFFPVENNSVFMEGNRYRTLLQFFIKDDIQNQGRKDATEFFTFTPNAIDKAIYNFYLLNLPTKNLFNFSECSKEYKRYSEALKTHEEKLRIETGKNVEEYRSEKLRLEASIQILRKRLGGYDFKDSHKEIEKKLTDVISNINEKSQTYHQLSQKIKNIKESYQLNQDIDTKQIQKIYNEVLSNFGNVIKKNLEEMKQFKEDLLENRNKFLVNKEKELEQSIDAVFKELSTLEEERTGLLRELKEKGALEKIERTYEDLITEQSALERQSQILIQVDEYNRILADQEIVLTQVRKEISDDVQNSQSNLNELRQLFMEILSSAIFIDESQNSGGYFDVSPNPKSPKTSLPFKIDVRTPKSSSKGQEVLKLLAYDLLIFINAMQQDRNVPDFLIHDGVFHGMSHKTMVSLLNYMYHKHLELYKTRNFQYIVTFSEDEIEVPDNKADLYGKFDFKFDDHKLVELEDVPNKMLFKKDIRN